ncbi:MAG: hypothetical protein E6L02_05065 [Thaumarchaeota archaeon]|nr:MAG: hypothetical protein E6L02_05065 [Nitrososphaerota archaeon]
METYRIEINLPKGKDSLFIEPISDVHRDDVNFDGHKWEEVITRIQDDSSRYTIGMGDYGSQIYTNPNEKRGAGQIVDEFKDNPVHLYETLVSELTPIKEKILLMLMGNHDLTVEKYSHINPIKELLTKPLGTRYGGYVCLVYLVVSNGEFKRTWKLFLTHGKFGGINATDALKKLERMGQGFDADVYLMGDRHDIVGDKRRFMTINSDGKLVNFDKIYGLCGCFVSGMQKGTTSYVETIMGLPNRVGTLTIEFRLSNGKLYLHA